MRSANLMVLVVAIAGCASGPKVGMPASDRSGSVSLKLRRYPGKEEVDISKDRGKVILLDFWATWCEPCKDALPTYQLIDRQFRRSGFQVYAINIDEDEQQIATFLRANPVELPILLDQGGVVAERQFGIKVMPTSFLLDKQGVIRHVHEGFTGDFLALYKSEIEKLLQEP